MFYLFSNTASGSHFFLIEEVLMKLITHFKINELTGNSLEFNDDKTRVFFFFLTHYVSF